MAQIRLIKNPFDRKCDLLTLEFGDNLQKIVDNLDMPQEYKDRLVVNKLDENLDNPVMIPREDWNKTFPRDNEYYQFMVKLSGGGGGGGGKSGLNMIAMTAILAVATWGAGLAASAAFSAAFSTAGTTVAASSLAGASIMGLSGMAVYGLTYSAVFALTLGVGSALISAPSQQNDFTGETKRVLTGSSNQASPYSPIPRIYGKTRFSPYKVVPDFVEQVGDDSYLRCIFCFGYGPLKLSEIQIGTDSLSAYSDVEYEIREGWPDDKPLTLYANTIVTSSYSIQLSVKNPPTIVTTRSDVEEAMVDITFPTGLWRQSGSKTKANWCDFEIKYRKKGSSDAWIMGANPQLYFTTQSSFTRSYRIKFPEKGTYELSVKRTRGYEAGYNYDESINEPPILSQVKNISSSYPIKAQGMCLLALRIKATDQLNGTINGISALCESYETRYTDVNSEPEIVLNRHPAWHVYDILTGTACVTPIDKSQIDIQSFIDWEKTYPDWYVDKAIDGGFTRLECINNMCSAAKALFTNINGKYTIVLDKAGKSPVAAISPRNSYGFSFSKNFEKELHGFKVKYIEPERDWTEQEVIVYNSGYNKDNATEFENIESYGCTSRELAWKWGKFMLGQYVLRPETYTVSQDVENLIVNIGDVVLLSHDVLKVGIGSARIKQVYYNEAGKVNRLWLDDAFELPQDRNYTMILRNSLGKLSNYAIDGNTESSYFVDLLNPTSDLFEDGDQVFIGETDRVTFSTIVTKIEPGDDLSATLTLVPEAPEIHDESDEEIPPFDPGMSDTPNFGNITPKKPIVSNVISDERNLQQDLSGSWQAGISFTVKPQENEYAPIEHIQVYYQGVESPFVQRANFPYTGNDYVMLRNVDSEGDNNTYHIKVRYVTRLGLVSEWTEFDTEVTGAKNPPPDVELLDRQGWNITWNYPDKPKDFAGFRVYYNHGFDTYKDHAVRAHTESLWASPPFSSENLPKGILTLFVVAVDNMGNESVNPALITFYNGDVEYDNVLWEYDYGKNNFPGSIANGNIFDNQLFANETSNFYGSDDVKFYKTDDENFYSDLSFSPLEYQFIVEYTGDIDNAYIKLDWEIEGDYKIYYKRESSEPFYQEGTALFYKKPDELFYPQDNRWFLFPDKLLIGRERVTIKIVLSGGEKQGIIRRLIAKVDAPDVSETMSSVDIKTGGTRLPITKKFKKINKVFLTLFGSGDAISYKVIDYNINGPMVICYDKNGNSVDAIVDADVRGYK